jgi:hypothetical protein
VVPSSHPTDNPFRDSYRDIAHGRHCIVHFDPFSDPHWNGKAYRVLAGSSSNAYNKYESGSCTEHMLSSIDRVRCWPDSLGQLLNLDRLVKASILAQLHRLAPPGMQKRVVVWIGALVVVFMLFTVFVSVYAARMKQNTLTQCSGCDLPLCSNACCLGPSNLPQGSPLPLHYVRRRAKALQGCWNMTNVNFFTSATNTFLDVVIFALPIPGLYKLQITRRKKGLSVSFSQHSVATNDSQ